MTRRRIHAEPRRRWTADEDATVRRLYPDQPTADLAAHLPGRTLMSIHSRAQALGVAKSAAGRAASRALGCAVMPDEPAPIYRCAHCLAPLRRARGDYHTACRALVARLRQRAHVRVACHRLRDERRAKGLCRDCGARLYERPKIEGAVIRRCFDCRERHRMYYTRRSA